MSSLYQSISLLILQIALIICYGLFTTYDVEVNASSSISTNSLSKDNKIKK